MIKRLAIAASALAIAALSSGPTSAADAERAGCTDVVLVGKVVGWTYAELPQTPGHINMDVLWTLDVAVTRVLKGSEHNSIVKVVVISDPRPLGARNDVFNLNRRSDGSYSWERSDETCVRFP